MIFRNYTFQAFYWYTEIKDMLNDSDFRGHYNPKL